MSKHTCSTLFRTEIMTGFEVDPEKTLPEPLHGSVVLRENLWISLGSKTSPSKNHRLKNNQTKPN